MPIIDLVSGEETEESMFKKLPRLIQTTLGLDSPKGYIGNLLKARSLSCKFLSSLFLKDSERFHLKDMSGRS